MVVHKEAQEQCTNIIVADHSDCIKTISTKAVAEKLAVNKCYILSNYKLGRTNLITLDHSTVVKDKVTGVDVPAKILTKANSLSAIQTATDRWIQSILDNQPTDLSTITVFIAQILEKPITDHALQIIGIDRFEDEKWYLFARVANSYKTIVTKHDVLAKCFGRFVFELDLLEKIDQNPNEISLAKMQGDELITLARVTEMKPKKPIEKTNKY
ncbi:uncharacterized protein LOC141909363 [Tubulanus polymorphus]|uniref:uncharacterized protein LOC141909363 n=1 Tax=Tubulanus polymorphus TaxID=672921 RepID=UPI003DA3E3DB